ncbi:alpha/beta hydrolase family protein [Oceaniglobus roseus]|uniref:alpha/beta hydrolase family protein n=1 Tax=Oceaniglobus roseus TaxID=1737570 RepID=UPI000C7E94A4|nr:dienelactone hydrolase [Kandeliimicrobium roseum]
MSLPRLALILPAALSLAAAAHGENRIDTQRADAPALAAYGDLPVGVRTIDMVHPGQLDILAIGNEGDAPDPLPTYDRPLTVEVWYPATADATGDTGLKAFLRDGKTEVTLQGRAMRDAAPATGTAWPLVILSHGYPGNRYLMSHLGENLASKGYVVASIDHTDSTYRTKAAFGSTLVNRTLDQLFVIDEMAKLGAAPDGFLSGIVDAERTGLIGYSMGGYGAVITAGAGVTQAAVDYDWGAPQGTLAIHLAGSESHERLTDPRIRTAIAFAPWGRQRGFWDAEGLKGIDIPMLFVAGSVDDVSGYADGTRAIWEQATNVDRALLTFDNANHNAGAGIPAPEEANRYDAELGFNLAEHYIDAVWDTARMNNVAQHFVTAWLAKYLKDDAGADAFLDLVPNSNDGVWEMKDDVKGAGHTYWEGFPNRTAKGMHFEVLEAGE